MKTYNADGELSALIRNAAVTREPLVVEADGVVYRLAVLPAEDDRPDPDTVKRSIASIRAPSGSWKDFDAEAFKSYIYERQRIASRPPVKL